MHVQQFTRCGKMHVVGIGAKLVLVENIVHAVVRHASESGLIILLVDVCVHDKVVELPQLVDVRRITRIDDIFGINLAMPAHFWNIQFPRPNPATELIVEGRVTNDKCNGKFHFD